MIPSYGNPYLVDSSLAYFAILHALIESAKYTINYGGHVSLFYDTEISCSF
jgi:hypothetical protein